jgi:hypothetical protein
LEVVARAWGIEWSEFYEEKFSIVEDVFRESVSNGQ